MFEFAPEGAPAFQVTVEIDDGTSENDVAQEPQLSEINWLAAARCMPHRVGQAVHA